jgi:hypothetical protein
MEKVFFLIYTSFSFVSQSSHSTMDEEIPVNTSSPPKEDTEMEVEHVVNTLPEVTTEESTIEQPTPPPAKEETVKQETESTTEAMEETKPLEEVETKEEPTETPVVDETKKEEEEVTPMEDVVESTENKEPPPFLSAPASWQIPVAALHQQQQQQQQQKPVDVPMSKANMRKERSEARIKENKYDIEAWTSLINDAQQSGDLEVIREVYERVLNVFPTSVSFAAKKKKKP